MSVTSREHRVPPHNLEAEESVLGSMMLSAEAIAEVIEVLESTDFYRSANSTIYRTIHQLFSKGEPVDTLTVIDALERAGNLEKVGGRLYVRDLVDAVPTPRSARRYAEIVAGTALRRRLITAAAEIMEMGYSAQGDPSEVADTAEQRMYDVARRETTQEIDMIGPLASAALEELEDMQSRNSDYSGLETGFRDLDRMTSGFQPGNFIVIAARPGIGKTSLAMNIAANVALKGSPVAVFSLEMSRHEIGMRVLCSKAGVPWNRIRAKQEAPSDWTRMMQAADALRDAPLHVIDSGNVNIVDIRAKARRLRSQGLSMIIVDYLQLMTGPDGGARRENRQQEVADISRSLKLLAKELEIPVVALSQLNRKVEDRAMKDRRPQLSDLRESGAIEQDSDLVMFIHRDDADPAKKNMAQLLVAKHRNGPTGDIELYFDPSLTRFASATQQQG